MSTENTSLSVDSAAALLRAEPEAPEAVEAPVVEEAPVEQAEEAAPEAVEETETEIEAPEEQVSEEVSEEAEEPAQPAVEPPAFYTKAEKEAFATLPPEQQQSIARLARDGEKHVAKIQQDIAAERKAFAERQAQIEQERKHYEELLLAQLPPEPDETLIDSNPVEYLRQQRAYEKGVAQLQGLYQKRQEEAAKEQAEVAAQEEEHRKAETAKLMDLIPELANPEQGPKIAAAIMSYGKAQGYDEATLSIANANDLLILHKASLWDNAQKAAKAAKAKPVPKVAAPGVGRSKAELQADQRKSALARLERSGSIEDAVALLRQ